MRYCGNPKCIRKVDKLYVKVGFEKPLCKNCFVDDKD